MDQFIMPGTRNEEEKNTHSTVQTQHSTDTTNTEIQTTLNRH